jgi:hypothetical protein
VNTRGPERGLWLSCLPYRPSLLSLVASSNRRERVYYRPSLVPSSNWRENMTTSTEFVSPQMALSARMLARARPAAQLFPATKWRSQTVTSLSTARFPTLCLLPAVWLSVCCPLSAAYSLLPALCCLLFAVCCFAIILMTAVYCLSPTIDYLLPLACYLLPRLAMLSCTLNIFRYDSLLLTTPT